MATTQSRSGVATREQDVRLFDRLRPESSRLGGLIWFVLMIGMWTAFFAALFADRLDAVQERVRDLPLVAELGLWLVAFPWLLGTAVWESSWAPVLRTLLVAAFAIGWTLISIPRSPHGAGSCTEP